MICDKIFREDMYYRISVFPLTTRPLRDRQHEIVLLVQWFINKYTQKMGEQINHIPQTVMDNLIKYNWPGNVRELENVMERAVTCLEPKRYRFHSCNTRKTIPEMLANY